VAPGAAAPPGQAEFSILSRRQANADMKVTVGERKDAQLMCVAGAPMVARQVIAAIRNRLNFHCPYFLSVGHDVGDGRSGPIAVRGMPMQREAAFNLRESISCGSVKRLARSLRTIKEAQVSGNATTEVEA
jgi:hypothetical protein